jgi:Uma2 family endonuclease
MSTLSETQLISYQEYRQFEADDNFLYELLNGRLVKKNAPSPRHQMILQNLNRSMDNHVYANKLGKVLFAPVDVFLDEYNAPHPDLVFVSKAKEKLITADGIMGVPDLVVEIVSPSSVVRDRVEKLKLYQKYQIPEYWIIDPVYESVEIYTLDKAGEYTNHAHVIKNGSVQSLVLKDWTLQVEKLFEAL